MFGLLAPARKLLSAEDRNRYLAHYCNLCGFLRSQYDLKSRMLVVNDIATLWWLIENPTSNEARSLKIANCLRGGTRRLKSDGPTELQRMLAAMSASTIGIKVRDDLEDGAGFRSRAMQRVYGDIFKRAEADLQQVGVDVARMNELLAEQRAIESEKEADFEQASSVTARAYGLVAAEIARRCDSQLTVDQAIILGERLGRSIYLIDAIRDFEQDAGASYNPLCLTVGSDANQLPFRLRHEVLSFIGTTLNAGRETASAVGARLRTNWHALERALLNAAGVSNSRSVTLYLGICIPCGDGAVIVEGKDIDDCTKACGSFCCCLICGAMCYAQCNS